MEDFEEKKKNLMFFCLAFAFSKSFGLLFIARAIQGVGSACSSVSGKVEKNQSINFLNSYRSWYAG
jgi:MFS family permease